MRRLQSFVVAACAFAALALSAAACSPAEVVANADQDAADGQDDAKLDIAKEVAVAPAITADLAVSPVTGNAPLPVDVSLTVHGCDISQVYLTWDFGDGIVSKAYDMADPANLGQLKFQYKYQFLGQYKIKALVSWKINSKKAHAEASADIDVKDAAALALSEINLVSQPTVAIGDDVTLTFSVLNTGEKIATPFEVGVYLSQTNTVDDSKISLGKLTVDGMPLGPSQLDYVWPPASQTTTVARFVVPKGLADGAYFVLVKADIAGIVNEFDRSDNEGVATTQINVNSVLATKSDLTLTPPEFNSAATWSPGDQLTYTHQLSNIGTGQAKATKSGADGKVKKLRFGVFLSLDSKLDFNDKLDPADPKQVDKMLTDINNSLLTAVAPGAVLPLTYSVNLPDVPDGVYHLIAKIDLFDGVDETDKTNNVAVSVGLLTMKKTIKTGFDLGITAMAVKPKGTFLTGSISVNYTVKSLGSDATPIFPVSVYFCPDNSFSDAVCVSNKTNFNIPPMAPGEEKTASQVITVSASTPITKYFIHMRLDPAGLLDELDEGNNHLATEYQIIVTAQANVDVWPTDVGFHPASVVAGGDLKLSYVVHNGGTSGSGAATTYYALAVDPADCSAGGVALGKATLLKKSAFNGIDGLDVLQISEVVAIPTGLDHKLSDYYVCVILDAENNIAKDSNKGNNAAASATTVKITDAKGGCFEDKFDLKPADNNSALTAAVLPIDAQAQYGSCGNEDWYKITVQKGYSLQVTLSETELLWTTPIVADLDLDLLAPDGVTLLDTQKAQSPVKKASALTVAAAGDYYVRIYPHVPGAMAHYQMLVKLTAPVQGMDLIGNNLAGSPQATFPGALLKTKFKLTNLGSKPSAAFVLRYVLSTDSKIDATDSKIIDVPMAKGVDALASINVDQALVLPLVPGGKYYLGVIIDANNSVVESDETNNTAFSNVLSLNTQAVCAADTYAGNVSADVAAALPASTANYPKLNVCPGLEDWFSVDVPKGKAFSAKATWKYQTGKGIVGVQILDASKTGVVAGAANLNTSLAAIPYVQVGGTYYIHVYVLPESGSALPYDYDLSVFVAEPDPSDVCLADYYESNNSAQSAPEIGCGIASLSLCLGDEDWFFVTMKANELIKFNFTSPGSAFQLKIFSNANLPPLKVQATTGIAEFTAPADGKYYLQISYKAPQSKPTSFAYTLKVDGGKGVDLTAKFTAIFPTQIVQGEDVYMTVTLANECQDPSKGFEYAYYYSTDDKLDPADKLLLTKPAAALLGKSTAQVDDKAIIPLEAKPGPAYVIVAIDATNTIAESQELNNTDASAVEVIKLCLADILEPNGAPQIAALLPAGKTADLSLCPFDLDWYFVDIKAGETITLTMGFDQAKGDLDMRLYKVNQFGQPVAVSATKKAPEQIIYTADVSTKFYLRINGFAGDANAYSLSMCKNIGGSCLECVDDSVCALPLVCDVTATVCSGKKCADDISVCFDDDACTLDTCVNKSCVNTADNCDDANSCTIDSCDAKKGCNHTNAADGLICAIGKCSAGVCKP